MSDIYCDILLAINIEVPEHFLKYLDGVALMTCSKASLSLPLYLKQTNKKLSHFTVRHGKIVHLISVATLNSKCRSIKFYTFDKFSELVNTECPAFFPVFRLVDEFQRRM